MPAPPFPPLLLLPPIDVTFPPVIVMEAVSPSAPTPGQFAPPVAEMVPPAIRMSPLPAYIDAPMAQASLPPVAVMVPLEIVIPEHDALSAPMPDASMPCDTTVPVVEMTMLPHCEESAAPMPAAWALLCAVEVAVTLALPEIVMSPHGL